MGKSLMAGTLPHYGWGCPKWGTVWCCSEELAPNPEEHGPGSQTERSLSIERWSVWAQGANEEAMEPGEERTFPIWRVEGPGPGYKLESRQVIKWYHL